MKCEQAQLQIDAYIDDELSLSEKVSFQTHIEDCPACSAELAQALRVHQQTQSMVVEPPESLKDRIRSTLTEAPKTQTLAVRIKETLQMKKKLGMRLGFASIAVAAVIVGAISLSPKPAQAASAKAVWMKMKNAATQLKAVHIKNWGEMGTGEIWSTDIWTDGQSLRWREHNGRLTVYHDGRLFCNGVESPKVADENGVEQMTFMPLTLEPEMFTLEWQLTEIGGENPETLDAGFVQHNGKNLRKLMVMGRDGQTRHTFWIDLHTNLPVRSVTESLDHGNWVDAGTSEYEFIDKIDPELLKADGLKEIELKSDTDTTIYEGDDLKPVDGSDHITSITEGYMHKSKKK